MYNAIFIFLLLTVSGFLFFFTAIISKNKLSRNKDILSGKVPKEKKSQDNEKEKNKQQLELESLLVGNSKYLSFIHKIDKNLKYKVAISLVIFLFYFLLFADNSANKKDMAMVFGGIFVAMIIIPGILTKMLLKRKIKKIMSDLPGFVDLVAICVQTGMTINASLLRVAEDFKTLNPDLSYIMLRIIRKAEIVGLLAALDSLPASLPTREIRMFTTVLQQSLNFGSSIYSHLLQLSSDMREMQLLTLEEYLGTLSAKMSVPLILFIMFPIVILIVVPGFMRVFPNV
ncbi:type II secretion system F family protein [Caviibacterium pharyngocola]|uniref:Pilus assembly protein TadC n=1 Tax=Caviibacterium pharyngocola TaxID=28159 RepID=A0A2M8RWT7_9PAST|nr:type II secretion system F family protein [Caviibacterium pharyngocola]PJG83360.1 pilus assembly protein TadC [Caviibacterium pharyngocola]